MKAFPGLGRFEKLANTASGAFYWIAGIAMVVMMLLSVVDLFAHKVFPTSWTFAGALEICGLLGLIIVGFSIPFTQILHGHTEIDFVTNKLPRRVQVVIASIVTFFGLVLFIFIAWQIFDFGLIAQAGGRVTSLEKIPISPFIYATAVCTLLMCLLLLLALVKLLKGSNGK